MPHNFCCHSGYIRMKLEDFTLTDMNKSKLVSLSRILAETKLTANSVLSSSLDFTLCYIHYIHKVGFFFNICNLQKV